MRRIATIGMVTIALATATLASQGQDGSGFGTAAEANRLRQLKADLDREQAGIARDRRWLDGQYQSFWGDSAANNADTRRLQQRISGFRCPNGLSLSACLGRPPVCRSALAFRSAALSEVERIQRRDRELNVRKQQLDQQKQSLDSRSRNLSMAIRNYNADLSDSARRAGRSSGNNGGILTFDDMVPKKSGSRP
jgi:hypothetical protein